MKHSDAGCASMNDSRYYSFGFFLVTIKDHTPKPLDIRQCCWALDLRSLANQIALPLVVRITIGPRPVDLQI